jgi:hypothetical protein
MQQNFAPGKVLLRIGAAISGAGIVAMRQDFDPGGAHSPAAVLAAGIVAAMSFAIVFNTAWNQPDLAAATLREMMGDVVEINAGEERSPGHATPARTHVIVAGDEAAPRRTAVGGLLLQVQQGLKALGYFTGPADGIDGELTRTAVRRFQERSGLPPDGKIDRQLLERIRRARPVSDSRIPAGDKARSADPRVLLVQTGLAELGYRPGLIDGFIGETTRRAIREFETDRGLPPTGEVSSALLDELKKVSGVSKLAAP